MISLKNGKKIAGVYGNNSFASAYPREQEIYIEEVWHLSEDGKNFVSKVDRTGGVLILGDEISSVEFINA